VEYARSKIGTPYVYGTKMEMLTREKFDWLQRTYGKDMVWDSDAGKIGKVCCDCSGLISTYTGVIQGSAQMKTAAVACYPIDTVRVAPVGAILWQQGHVGIYAGLENGEPVYIAEDGSAANCRKNKVSKAKFTHWLLMSYIQYKDSADYKDKEEDIVTQEQFNAMMDVWLKTQAAKPVDASLKAEFEAAKTMGITDGSRPMALATRAEVAVMASRARR